jgi:rhodanese-related sulfurtransferase
MSMRTAAHLIAEARARIENLSPVEVAIELERGDVLLVDLREAEERQSSIPGAIHAPRGMLEIYADPNSAYYRPEFRGMLEFYADPTSAYYRPEFNPDRRTILYCASGGRSALAADTLRGLGYTQVAHLDGGFKAWREAGLPLEAGS